MGRTKKNRNYKWKNKKPRDQKADEYTTNSFEDVIRENDMLESYYKAQNIVPEEEWEEFMSALRRELPSTFRITGTRSHAKDLLRILKTNFVSQTKDEGELEEKPLECLNWYPDELAWETKIAKREIRRSEKLKQLHKFLVDETNCGTVTRQEAVSMIPPLFMDIKPHHKVLDMCAAPGSKTAQLLEMMNEDSDKELPSGVVVANDANNKRCYMLVHQSKRLQSACCMVTNHDASVYPFLTTVNESTGCREPLLFDRILCDVPCSGDGTLRKNPQIWPRWTPHLGVALHRLQLKILVRGLELLAENGRIVYSTCAMNPLEDEAVIATAIRMSQGAIELVDVSSHLPHLKRSQGLTSWKVCDKKGNELKSCQELTDVHIHEGYKKTMFPPTEEENKEFQLQRCVRVCPHQQDTGGFFIAALIKKGPLPWQSKSKTKRMAHKKLLPWEYLEKKAQKSEKTAEEESMSCDPCDDEKDADEEEAISKGESGENDQKESADLNGKDVVAEPPRKKVKKKGYLEDPFIFLEEDDLQLKEIVDYFGFPATYPKQQTLIRTIGGMKRHVYFVSKCVKEIIEHNVENLKIINGGLRIFSRCSLKTGETEGCQFRLTQEGIETTHRFTQKQKVEIAYEDLVLLLTEGEPRCTKLTESTHKQLDENGFGSILWHYKPTCNSSDSESVQQLSSDIWMSGYRAKKTVRSMMAKSERMHLLRILGLSTDILENVKTNAGSEEEKQAEGLEDVEDIELETENAIENDEKAGSEGME